MAGKLYVMVGLSASGKSSIAREIASKEHALIISTDAIRGELSGGNPQKRVWEKNKTMSKWEKRLGTDKTKLLLDFHECDCARE